MEDKGYSPVGRRREEGRSMIQINNLSKSFGKLSVLENISTEINKGDVISIIGPSGCGKSTFMRCINLMEKPTKGEIIIDGNNILAKNADVYGLRKKMGMVFQSFNLFPHLMIIENIMLAPVSLRKLSRQQAYEEGIGYLEMVGLGAKAMAFPDELSGGQKQRAAIARALAMRPEILLLDEPTSALDPTMVSEVLAVIRKLAASGMTMMIVTHEMKFAKDVSGRVFYMDEKGIYEDGTPAQIFNAPQKSKTRAFIKKISSFVYDIQGKGFDLYELQARVEGFLAKQMFPQGRIRNIQLVCEELLSGILLRRFPDAWIALTVEYSDTSGEVTVQADFAGAVYDFKSDASDEMSLAIIKKFTKDISATHTEGKNTLQLVL